MVALLAGSGGTSCMTDYWPMEGSELEFVSCLVSVKFHLFAEGGKRIIGRDTFNTSQEFLRPLLHQAVTLKVPSSRSYSALITINGSTDLHP